MLNCTSLRRASILSNPFWFLKLKFAEESEFEKVLFSSHITNDIKGACKLLSRVKLEQAMQQYNFKIEQLQNNSSWSINSGH